MSLFEQDKIRWQFNELIKTLITISLSADKQRQIIGIGWAGDEMMDDFYTYYTLIRDNLLERGFIKNQAIILLDQLDKFTDQLSKEKHEDFWNEIEAHSEWEQLRGIAKAILLVMNLEELGLKVKHENEVDENNAVIAQKTFIELVDKHGKLIEI